MTLDKFTIGISSVDAAVSHHGLNPNLGGRPISIILWTDDKIATRRVWRQRMPHRSRHPTPSIPISTIFAQSGWQTQTEIEFRSFKAVR
ncbi:MAG TPA: hypothetical protein VEC08_05380 [Nitrososphaerales archaeon]|nr:hypothetical protein [Nitrososphaerales archaeon]